MSFDVFINKQPNPTIHKHTNTHTDALRRPNFILDQVTFFARKTRSRSEWGSSFVPHPTGCRKSARTGRRSKYSEVHKEARCIKPHPSLALSLLFCLPLCSDACRRASQRSRAAGGILRGTPRVGKSRACSGRWCSMVTRFGAGNILSRIVDHYNCNQIPNLSIPCDTEYVINFVRFKYVAWREPFSGVLVCLNTGSSQVLF